MSGVMSLVDMSGIPRGPHQLPFGMSRLFGRNRLARNTPLCELSQYTHIELQTNTLTSKIC